jgi:hypothetical protein
MLGLENRDENSVKILRKLNQFNTLIAFQVERELHHNLNAEKLNDFYSLANKTHSLKIDFELPPDSYIQAYRRQGLKQGDAKIAAFCEWRNVDMFVSENRHFLDELSGAPFKIVNSEKFCKIYKI